MAESIVWTQYGITLANTATRSLYRFDSGGASNPVVRQTILCVFQCHLSGTDQRVQFVFSAMVFLASAVRLVPTFGPKIIDDVCTSVGKRISMVDFAAVGLTWR